MHITQHTILSKDEIEALDAIWSIIDQNEKKLTEAEIDELDRLNHIKKRSKQTPHEI